jgi:hypothetical protein
MKTTHPGLWGAGWAGLAAGGALTLFGLTSLSEVASLAGGYGVMLMGSAAFLLVGLKLVERQQEWAESRRVRRIAIARLPQRPPSRNFGEQSPASDSAPATVNRTS